MKEVFENIRTRTSALAGMLPGNSMVNGSLLLVFLSTTAAVVVLYITFPAAVDVFSVLCAALIAVLSAFYGFKNRAEARAIPNTLLFLATGVAAFLFVAVARSGFSSSSLFGFGFPTGTAMSWLGALLGIVGGSILFTEKSRRSRLLYVMVVGLGLAALVNVILTVLKVTPFIVHSHGTFSNFILFGAGLLITTVLLTEARKMPGNFFFIGTFAQTLFFLHVFLSKSSDLMFVSGLGVIVSLILAILTREGVTNVFHSSSILSAFFGLTLVVASLTTPVFPQVVHDIVGTPNQEIRPSTLATIRVGVSEMKENPTSLFIGSGPNSFREVWNMHMPRAVNSTKFWNEDFSTGSSLLLTTLIEFGAIATVLLSSLAIAVVALLLFKVFRKRRIDLGMLATAVAVVFLGTWFFLYTPKVLVLCIAGILGGSLVHRVANEQEVKNKIRKSLDLPFLVALLVSGLVVGILAVFHLIALHLYGLGSAQLQKNPPEYANAATRFEQSLSFARLPETQRNAALAFTGRSQKELEGQITEGSIQRAIEHAQSATTLADNARMSDPRNYRTHIVLGEALLLEGILKEDVALIESAIQSFENAFARAPFRLLSMFGKARALASLEQGEEEARELLIHILKEQPGYKPAQELLETLGN